MWIPTKLFELFTLAADQRLELQRLRIENEHLLRDLSEAKSNFKWLTVRCNALEGERAVLLEKVYDIKIAAPYIQTQPNTVPDFNTAIFEDLEEMEASRKLTMDALPKWGN